jgi:hypothetical protein
VTRNRRQRAEAGVPATRRFHLYRKKDESGVSGTGVVAVGAQFPSGRCIIEWVSQKTDVSAVTNYDTIQDLKAIHGHNGATHICWEDA